MAWRARRSVFIAMLRRVGNSELSAKHVWCYPEFADDSWPTAAGYSTSWCTFELSLRLSWTFFLMVKPISSLKNVPAIKYSFASTTFVRAKLVTSRIWTSSHTFSHGQGKMRKNDTTITAETAAFWQEWLKSIQYSRQGLNRFWRFRDENFLVLDYLSLSRVCEQVDNVRSWCVALVWLL